MKIDFFKLSIVILISVWILTHSGKAIASDPERVLRSQLNSLDRRIRSLETQVRRLQGVSTETRSPDLNSSPNPQMVEGELIGRSDPLMERFATLLIELREDLKALETKVTRLSEFVGY